MEERTCLTCGARLTKKPGRGRWPKYCESHRPRSRPAANSTRPLALVACRGCGVETTRPCYCSDVCRIRARDAARRVPCAGDCGSLLFGSSTSLPPGERMCRPCRKARNLAARRQSKIAPAWRGNAQAGIAIEKRPALTTAERGYGAAHQRRRRELLPLSYGSNCPFCGEVMLEGQALDLDHTDPSARLLGLPGDRISHSACNRREGGLRGAATTNRRFKGGPMKHCENCLTGPIRPRARTCSRACWQELRRKESAWITTAA